MMVEMTATRVKSTASALFLEHLVFMNVSIVFKIWPIKKSITLVRPLHVIVEGYKQNQALLERSNKFFLYFSPVTEQVEAKCTTGSSWPSHLCNR